MPCFPRTNQSLQATNSDGCRGLAEKVSPDTLAGRLRTLSFFVNETVLKQKMLMPLTLPSPARGRGEKL